MKRAVKTHFKDFIAIAVLIVLALAVLLVILSNQKAALPSWVPGLGQEFYSINAEFETAQAITPGQGQATVIAGINVGKVGAATLDNGVAKVRLDIEPEYKELLHQDAEFLLRPKTALSDMVVEIDPGTTGPPPEEGETLPLAQGLSNIQLEQFFATLDGDTRNYLTLLLAGAGEGLGGQGGNQLSQALRRLGPFTRYTAKLTGELEKRRDNIKGGVRAFSLLATELGNNDQVVADFITNSKNNLEAWADEEASLREALQEFPPTLIAGQDALAKSNQLSLVLRPTLLGLIPGAENLRASLRSVQDLAINTTSLVRDDIRPFTRNVQPVFRDLGRTSRSSEVTTAEFRGFFTNVNRLFNLLAYNPQGSQEGFLFWAPWAAHNLNSSSNAQDGSGPVRRGISSISCNTGTQAFGISGPAVPQLLTIYRLAQLPPPTNPADGGICPNVPPAGP